MNDPGGPRVSVIVPCTRPHLVPGIAAALAADPDAVPCELIVAGRVGELDATSFPVTTTLIESDPRLLHRMRRQMVEVARGDVLAFLDDDAVPLPGWLSVAADLRDGSREIWTGPEVPVRSGPGPDLAAAVAASWLAEGHRAHVETGGRPVRWSEAPFCNLVVGRSDALAIGLPDEALPWDVDDFDFCSRAASRGVSFRSVSELTVAHDRYPDRVAGWLRRKAGERRRTGEKLVRYPRLYLRVPSVVVVALAPWGLVVAMALAGRRRRWLVWLLGGAYGTLLLGESLSGGRRGLRAAAHGGVLAALHAVSTVAVQVGVVEGACARLVGRDDRRRPPVGVPEGDPLSRARTCDA